MKPSRTRLAELLVMGYHELPIGLLLCLEAEAGKVYQTPEQVADAKLLNERAIRELRAAWLNAAQCVLIGAGLSLREILMDLKPATAAQRRAATNLGLSGLEPLAFVYAEHIARAERNRRDYAEALAERERKSKTDLGAQ